MLYKMPRCGTYECRDRSYKNTRGKGANNRPGAIEKFWREETRICRLKYEAGYKNL